MVRENFESVVPALAFLLDACGFLSLITNPDYGNAPGKDKPSWGAQNLLSSSGHSVSSHIHKGKHNHTSNTALSKEKSYNSNYLKKKTFWSSLWKEWLQLFQLCAWYHGINSKQWRFYVLVCSMPKLIYWIWAAKKSVTFWTSRKLPVFCDDFYNFQYFIRPKNVKFVYF